MTRVEILAMGQKFLESKGARHYKGYKTLEMDGGIVYYFRATKQEGVRALRCKIVVTAAGEVSTPVLITTSDRKRAGAAARHVARKASKQAGKPSDS